MVFVGDCFYMLLIIVADAADAVRMDMYYSKVKKLKIKKVVMSSLRDELTNEVIKLYEELEACDEDQLLFFLKRKAREWLEVFEEEGEEDELKEEDEPEEDESEEDEWDREEEKAKTKEAKVVGSGVVAKVGDIIIKYSDDIDLGKYAIGCIASKKLNYLLSFEKSIVITEQVGRAIIFDRKEDAVAVLRHIIASHKEKRSWYKSWFVMTGKIK